MFQDIVFAAILALILTWLIRTGSRAIKIVVTKSAEIGYNPMESEMVLQRCYNMFPIDNLRFKGAIFRRGMTVRAVMSGKRVIEGRFVGTNEDDMVCFMTHDYVIARKLENIEEMREMGNEEY